MVIFLPASVYMWLTTLFLSTDAEAGSSCPEADHDGVICKVLEDLMICCIAQLLLLVSSFLLDAK